jgi:hypothetical protein
VSEFFVSEFGALAAKKLVASVVCLEFILSAETLLSINIYVQIEAGEHPFGCLVLT